MNRTTTSPRRTTRFGLLAAAAVALAAPSLLVSPATARQAQDAAAQRAARNPVQEATRFIQLKLQDADTIWAHLEPVLGPEFQRVEPRGTPRPASTLGVNGPKDRIQRLEDLARILDTGIAFREQGSRVLQFHDVRFPDRTFVREVVATILFGEGVELGQFSISAQGTLSVLALPETQAKVTRALAELDELAVSQQEAPAAPPVATDLQLRLTWLVSGAAEGEGRSPGPDMAAVVRELEGMGLEGWRELGRSFVRSASGEPFLSRTSFGSPGQVGSPIDFTWSGRFRAIPDGTVRIENAAELSQESGTIDVDLSSTVELVSGQRVVLGLTPLLDRHLVAVLEVARSTGG